MLAMASTHDICEQCQALSSAEAQEEKSGIAEGREEPSLACIVINIDTQAHQQVDLSG